MPHDLTLALGGLALGLGLGSWAGYWAGYKRGAAQTYLWFERFTILHLRPQLDEIVTNLRRLLN